MEDGLAEFFARAPAAATAETHFAAQWKAYASDEPLTAALWLINNADPGAFHEAPARTAALKKAGAKEDSLEKQTEILADLRDRYQNITISDKGKVFNTELLEAIELEYLLDMSDTTVASVLHRKERRGALLRPI